MPTEFRGYPTVHLGEKFIFYEAMLKNEQIIHIPTEFHVDGISCQQNSVSMDFRGYPTVHLVEKFIFLLNNVKK